MSAADRLLPDYLRALTELLDPEIDLLLQMMANRQIHPMGVKTLLAANVTSTIHGLQAAETSRAGFAAQFPQKRFSDAPDLVVDSGEHGTSTIAELFVKVVSLVPSLNQVRRAATGGGLRLIAEAPGGAQQSETIGDANATLRAILDAHTGIAGRMRAARS